MTTGKITSFVFAFKTRSHDSYYVQADYFDVNGKCYSCLSNWGVGIDYYFKIGDEVKIRYEKDNPMVSYMPPPQHIGPMTMLLAAIGLGVLIVPRVMRNRNRDS